MVRAGGLRREEHAQGRALDVGRALAIIAVIYGHALAPWFLDTHGWFSEAAFLQWKLGASFMMPFFFFLSGLAWRSEKSARSVMREMLVLLATAWAASVVMDVIRLLISWVELSAALGQEPMTLVRLARHAARMALLGDFYSISALWFLAALGLVRVLAAIAARLGPVSGVAMILVLMAAGLTAQVLGWRNIHQIYLLGVALACFLAGSASRGVFAMLLRHMNWNWAVLAVAGAVLMFTFDRNQGCTFYINAVCGIGPLENRFGVSMIHGGFGNLFWFWISASAGIAFALAGTILLSKSAAGARLALMGRASISLLIVNGVILELANPSVHRWVAPAIPADTVGFFVVLLAVAGGATLLGAAVLRSPLRRLREFARWAARFVTDLIFPRLGPLAWGLRRHRVPAGND